MEKSEGRNFLTEKIKDLFFFQGRETRGNVNNREGKRAKGLGEHTGELATSSRGGIPTET